MCPAHSAPSADPLALPGGKLQRKLARAYRGRSSHAAPQAASGSPARRVAPPKRGYEFAQRGDGWRQASFVLTVQMRTRSRSTRTLSSGGKQAAWVGDIAVSGTTTRRRPPTFIPLRSSSQIQICEGRRTCGTTRCVEGWCRAMLPSGMACNMQCAAIGRLGIGAKGDQQGSAAAGGADEVALV